ncbi:hypothetical protein ACFL2K_04375 [Candidatus Margulisiibacteriota bacterium]
MQKVLKNSGISNVNKNLQINKKLEIEKIKKTIIQSVKNSLLLTNTSKRGKNIGIFYAEDYKKFDIKIDPFKIKFNEKYFITKKLKISKKEHKDMYINRVKLIPGKLPSEAIKDIFSKTSFVITDCGTLMCASFYKAILDVIGDKKFNKLFYSQTNSILTLNPVLPLDDNAGSLRYFFTDKYNNWTRPGYWTYMHGVKNYLKKHPSGSSVGVHIFCAKKNKFSFFDQRCKKPLSGKEIKNILLLDYNKDVSSGKIEKGKLNKLKANLKNAKGLHISLKRYQLGYEKLFNIRFRPKNDSLKEISRKIKNNI